MKKSQYRELTGQEPEDQFAGDADELFDDDDDDFEPCSECDGHDACRDFGCAFKHGLGHLVKTPL